MLLTKVSLFSVILIYQKKYLSKLILFLKNQITGFGGSFSGVHIQVKHFLGFSFLFHGFLFCCLTCVRNYRETEEKMRGEFHKYKLVLLVNS